MPSDFSQIRAYLIAALIIVMLYFRLRRTFGRQLFRPIAMVVRMSLFAMIGLLVSPTMLRSAGFAAAATGGLAGGVLLAAWGAARTAFERVDERLYYVPHTYTGIAVTLLFIGRVAFRLLQASTMPGSARLYAPSEAQAGLASYVSSPLTLGLLYVLVGYYVCYFGLVLWKSKRLDAGAVTAAGRAEPGAP